MEENEFNTAKQPQNEPVYTDGENTVYEPSEPSKPPIKDNKWLKYAGIIILAGFCMPVVGLIYDYVPKILIAIAAAVLLVFIIKAVNERDKGRAVIRDTDPERIETCSDIKSLSLDLSGATFIINQGLNFSINGSDERHFKSYIKKGVWHIESMVKSNKTAPYSDTYPVTISLPQSFNADKAAIKLRGAKLLIYGISAYKASVNAESSETDIRNIYAQSLDIRADKSSLRANAMTNGDVSITASKSKVGVNLGCYADSLNYNASVKNGRVTIGDRTAERGGIAVDNRASGNLKITCENGETAVTFRQGAVNNG